MQFLKRLVALFVLPANLVLAGPLPDIFYEASILKLPISVGKSSYGETLVSSSKYIESYDVAQNEEHYDAMVKLHRSLMADTRQDFFSFNNEQWSHDKNANITQIRSWGVSRLSCIEGVKCFLLSPDSGVWLIIEKGNEITDFQLVNAMQYYFDEKGNSVGPIANLDTVFGDNDGFYPYSSTHYEKTGIFCSMYVTKPIGGIERIQLFKRRITQDGKIESKPEADGSRECTAPW